MAKEYMSDLGHLITSLDEDPEDTVRVSFSVYARGSSRIAVEHIFQNAIFIGLRVDTSGSVHRFFRSLYSVKISGKASDIKIIMQKLQRSVR